MVHPPPRRLLRNRQHLRCRCWPIAPSDDAGRGDDLGGEAGAGELEAEEVIDVREEAGDVEQRVVRDAVAEQRARRRGHLARESQCHEQQLREPRLPVSSAHTSAL